MRRSALVYLLGWQREQRSRQNNFLYISHARHQRALLSCTAQLWPDRMDLPHFFSRSQDWIRGSPNLLVQLLRRSVVCLWFIPAFAGWMLAISLLSKERASRSRYQADDASGISNQAAQTGELPFLKRMWRVSYTQLRELCRPKSIYIPLLSSIMALLYAVRIMEGHHLSLAGTEAYQTTCPAGSRRTATAAFVKLFAATVTTVGVHGHLDSLNGSTSWKFEVFRAIELCIMPLASVLAFTCSVWYGFIDLLAFGSGPWSNGMTARYRFARLCGCFLTARVPSGNGRRYPIWMVAPHHLTTIPLEKDLRWCGRVLILFVLIAQYSQAVVLMIRRILSDTAAGVDYAMFFLALSGLTALFRSLAISLLNVSWTPDGDIQPCIEPLCNFPVCLTFKESQGLSSKEIRIMAFGNNIAFIPNIIRYQLAAGFLQCSILLRLDWSLPYNIMVLWITHAAWRSTLYCVAYTSSFWSLVTQDPASSQMAEVLPDPVAQGDQGSASESWTVSGALITIAFSVVGIATVAWLCVVLFLQLTWLILPCVVAYCRIALETAHWRYVDGAQPCLQLWKDELEDELWWF